MIADCYSKRGSTTDIDNNYIDLNKEKFRIYLTTNYDRMIEDHIPGINSFNSLTEYTSNTQRLFKNNEEKYLFHIHGCVSNPSTITISSEKYEELYSDSTFDNMMRLFSGSFSFLFLGFSFNDVFVKSLVRNHKEYFKGTHYLLVNSGQLSTEQKGSLSREYGLKIIEYDIFDSTHAEEIRKILNKITGEDTNLSQAAKNPTKDTNHTSIGVDDLINCETETHEESLFYRKLKIANVGESLSEVSKLFYIAAEKFIRKSESLGLPKEFINQILAEVFMKYKERYVELYDIKGKTSEELLIEIHSNLEKINIDRLVNDTNRPTDSESKGFVHVLADDEEKDVWWGRERL
nr:ABC-three component system protein [Virgibacillus salarius]